MTILHGSWILDSGNSYLFIWGETWRPVELPTSSAPLSLHPFNVSQAELLPVFKTYQGQIQENIPGKELTQVITLPSQPQGKNKGLIPFISRQKFPEELSRKNITLHSWQVEGIALTPLEAIQFLQGLPLYFGEGEASSIGDDLKFWTHIYRWSLDLLVRGKFLPGIIEDGENTPKSCWYPLLDSSSDQTYFAKFTQSMPLVCRSYFNLLENQNFANASELLLKSLSLLIDTQLRLWGEHSPNLNKTLMVQPWLQSLLQLESKFELESKNINRLKTALYNWTLPIQEYLVTEDNTQLGQNQFRVCFVLQPPPAEKLALGETDWKLSYVLQALDDSNFLIEADRIWQQSINALNWQGRSLENPQEILLKGLGLASRLYEPIAQSLETKLPRECLLNPIDVYQFIRSKVWELQDNGLGVILPTGLTPGADEKRLGIKVEAEVIPKKGERLSLKTLLNYRLKLAIGNQTVTKAEFEKILAQKSPIVQINGEWVALQPADVRAAQGILNQTNEGINLSVEDALRFSSGEEKIVAKLPVVGFEASGILADFINTLTHNQAVTPIEKPQGLKGELRPYQGRGVGWLAFLTQWGLGACLADDMGLGKTIQLLGFILNLKAQEDLETPILVVCPTSVLNNWEREIHKFSPTLSALIHHGNERKKGKAFTRAIQGKHIVITSYSLLYRDATTLEEINWQGVVLDEAQNVKNPQAKQSQAVRKLKAGFRIALTGTPVENHLSELWSILEFLNPGFLGTQQFFQKRFAIPIEKYGERQALNILRSLVRPFILRRLKTDKDIIQDLPEKQEMNVFCGLSLEQANLYESAVNESLTKIDESEGIQRHGLILSLLTKLKQICNHPAQYLKETDLKSPERSGKLLRLEEMLEELVDEGDRALIFTQFAEWGKLLKPYLQHKLKREVLYLYGAIPRNKRQEMIDQFQNDPKGPPIFILSLKAGGTGLNLTRANHVFHIDRWWNPAVENQATDRAFRIGQKQNVQVHKFICTGTLEEKINEMIESKKQLAEQTVDAGENWLTQLDTDQLRNLLLLDRNAVIDE